MIEWLRTFNILQESDLQQLQTLLKPIKLLKGEHLEQEGKTSRQLCFLTNGILRSYFTNDNGEPITNCIIFEKHWIAALTSFITQQPAQENIQAIVDCELLALDRNTLYTLYEENIRWANMGRVLIEKEFVEMEQRILAFQKLPAKDRYERLLQEQPRLVQQIPLQYLASYLGITPQHLSRLRRAS
ncbi:Crp/Fnr family transcriptional regulator [Chitinophaga nivalis]|uniref:Crp/Fnr family transcriptional regulator n=1 Tax=Chitinophaga nivalis TaxID=2991709 RepID=A0ABT3IR05_9BACT|nr:Crp/Fnr family transcriptional regulator [Chitinophaga nivalis]MCW3463902.1 Crp/Fnr family transcriptional regulator [Chitinophaga nivalis]MCW3486408.1 Crp/Fnr family transcriptional regulator [Chitinophaga nivalis]